MPRQSSATLSPSDRQTRTSRSTAIVAALSLLVVSQFAACGGNPDGSRPAADGTVSASSSSDEFFELTLSGPAFPVDQTYRIDPDRVRLNLANGGGLTMRFSARDNPVASVDGSSELTNFTGGMGPSTPNGIGTYSVGASSGAEGGWAVYVYPTGCERGSAGCDRVSVETESGTMEVTRYLLGKGLSRPHAEGPTALAASFALEAREMGRAHKGRRHSVRAAFHLVNNPG